MTVVYYLSVISIQRYADVSSKDEESDELLCTVRSLVTVRATASPAQRELNHTVRGLVKRQEVKGDTIAMKRMDNVKFIETEIAGIRCRSCQLCRTVSFLSLFERLKF